MLGGADKESVGKRMKGKPRPVCRIPEPNRAPLRAHLPDGHFSGVVQAPVTLERTMKEGG